MAVSAAAAAVLSFAAWRDLALYTGGDPRTAWVLPIAVDVLAAGALTAYVLWRDWLAHAVALFVVAVSATGNALSHLYRVRDGAATVAPTWVVTALWTLPPLVLYLNSQLYARKLRKDADDRPRTGAAPGARGDDGDTGGHELAAGVGQDGARPGPVRAARGGDGAPVPGADRPGPPSPARRGGDGARARAPARARPPSTDELARALADQDLTGLTRRQVADRFHVANARAGDALRAARAARDGGA